MGRKWGWGICGVHEILIGTDSVRVYKQMQRGFYSLHLLSGPQK